MAIRSIALSVLVLFSSFYAHADDVICHVTVHYNDELKINTPIVAPRDRKSRSITINKNDIKYSISYAAGLNEKNRLESVFIKDLDTNVRVAFVGNDSGVVNLTQVKKDEIGEYFEIVDVVCQ